MGSGPPRMDYTAEFSSDGDHNAMGTGVLVCSIMSPQRFVALDVFRVEILHNNELIADTNGEFKANRYNLVVANRSITEYTVHLHIEALSQADAGIYTCKAYGHELETLSETLLQFDVNYLPDNMLYPTCTLLGSRRAGDVIQPGESVSLLCSSVVGRPVVQLEWQEVDGVDFTTVLHTESEQYVQTEVTLEAVYVTDGLKLTCTSRSEAFPDYRGSCTLGPLNIAQPSDEGTTGVMSTTEVRQNTLTKENIGRGATPGGSEVNKSSVTPSLSGEGKMLLGDNSVLMIAVAVLSTILCISIIFNIYCATRSKRRAKTAKNQESESNYQGLNNSPVTQGPYTALNTPEISLKTVTKKSTVVNYTEATAGEEDYAQVDNPLSPRHLEDTVQRYRESPGNSDSAYVNLNIPSRSKLYVR